jgi:hypothetical protein
MKNKDSNLPFRNGKKAQDLSSITTQLAESTQQRKDNVSISATDFGLKANANYFNSSDGKWYVDSGYTKLSDDDAPAIQAALDFANSTKRNGTVVISGRCLIKTPITMYTGVRIKGVGSMGSTGFAGTVIYAGTSMESMFVYNLGVNGCWHWASVENLRLDGKSLAQNGIYIYSTGETSYIDNVFCLNFLNAGIKLEQEFAPATIRNVSLMSNKYGLEIVDGRHTLGVTGISGDLNDSLIHFLNCQPSLSAVIQNIKSEKGTNNTTSNNPVILVDNCDGSQISIIGGSIYGASGNTSDDVMRLTRTTASNYPKISFIGTTATYYNNLLNDTITSNVYPIPANFVSDVFVYNHSVRSYGQGNFVTTDGLYFRKSNNTFQPLIKGMSDDSVRLRSLGSSGYVLVRLSDDTTNVFDFGRGNKQYSQSYGNIKMPIKTVTSSYTLTVADSTVLVDASSGNKTITLPSAEAGLTFTVKKIDSSVNTVTLSSTANIDGSTNKVLSTQYDKFTLISDGTNWFIR